MDRATWIIAFTSRLLKIGEGAEPRVVSALAATLYLTEGHRDPVDVAMAELDAWPPTGERGTAL